MLFVIKAKSVCVQKDAEKAARYKFNESSKYSLLEW